jgi:hypothetical protein
MTDTENIESRLRWMSESLNSISSAIDNISMPDFDAEATEYALFPGFTQDVSMYRDFDWEAIGAKVVKTDRDGATAVLYKGNIFKRGANLDPKHISIHYTVTGQPQAKGLIRFKDMELEDIKPFENTIGQKKAASENEFSGLFGEPSSKDQQLEREYKAKLQEIKVLAEVLGDFKQAAQYCREAIKLVNSLIQSSEQDYNLNRAAELKYGTLLRLQERLKDFQKRAKD